MTDCERMMADVVDVALGKAAPDLALHAASCQACGAKVARVGAALAALPAWEIPWAPDDLTGRAVHRAFRADRARRYLRRAAAAAVLVAAFGLGSAASARIEQSVASTASPTCEDHLREVGLAVQRFQADHGRLPPAVPAEMVATLLAGGYVRDPSVFTCPDADVEPGSTSYVIIGQMWGQSAPILADRAGNHPGMLHVILPGGRIEAVDDRDLGRRLAEWRARP